MFESYARSFISGFFAEGRRIFMEDFVGVLPDIVGYVALACAACMMFCPMVNRSIIVPFGAFAVVGISAAVVLGAG